jgi:hypothetical protein
MLIRWCPICKMRLHALNSLHTYYCKSCELQLIITDTRARDDGNKESSTELKKREAKYAPL